MGLTRPDGTSTWISVNTQGVFTPGEDLPLFVAPIGETRAIVETVTTEQVRTTSGSIAATHYVLTEIRRRPTRVDLWTNRGRLLRLDLPATSISVVRADVRR